MIDLDKFLSLFYEHDDPCYVLCMDVCILCFVCFVRGVCGVLRSVSFGLVCFLLTFGHLFCFFFLFFLSIYHGLGALAGVWHWNGMGWDTRYKANSASRISHIPISSIDISDNNRRFTYSTFISNIQRPWNSVWFIVNALLRASWGGDLLPF